MLGFFVVGEDQAFIIEIDRTKTISQLRDTIKAYKENVFKTLDANQLRLWKVNIPLIKAREINAETNIAQKFGAVELKDVFDTIEEHFGTNPTAKNIHVIVQPPPPVTSASSMHNEVKIEVKNKVLKAFSHINPNSVDGTPKEWLFEQLQIDINYIGAIKDILRNVNYISVFRYIVECLHVKSLILILDEAQVLCRTGYGKYNGSSKSNKKWSLLQAYVEHLTHRPVTCLIAGTYLHMATGIPLVASMGKTQSLHAHIVLKLLFLSHDDVLWNLEAVIDLTDVTPKTRDILGYFLRGRPRNCASFMSTDIADYLEDACNYVGADNLYPEKAIMDSPECIVPRHDESFSEEITINPSFESYLIPGIEAFFQRRGKSLVDVFIDNIILLNNNSSIGNEFDAVFITAIIQKRGCNVRDELNKWKNGQQFDLPSWITSTMKFVTISNLSNAVPLARYVSDETYCRRAIQLEPCSGSDLKLVIPAANEEDDLEDDDLEEDDLGEGDLEEEEYGQDLDFDGVDYDLNYTENTKNYRVSDKKNHEAIKNSTKNRKHIYISVELPRRWSKRLKLFRINEYGDLVIIVDDRNMEHVFGPVIKNLMETLRQRCENKENSMDLTE
ncbi:hypothetical protein RhiirB3_434161 [Rhizophagus irregularis]|nr:hypothetical protein RhiirB3_434161 [Rhizophagus irregularis]